MLLNVESVFGGYTLDLQRLKEKLVRLQRFYLNAGTVALCFRYQSSCAFKLLEVTWVNYRWVIAIGFFMEASIHV